MRNIKLKLLSAVVILFSCYTLQNEMYKNDVVRHKKTKYHSLNNILIPRENKLHNLMYV